MYIVTVESSYQDYHFGPFRTREEVDTAVHLLPKMAPRWSSSYYRISWTYVQSITEASDYNFWKNDSEASEIKDMLAVSRQKQHQNQRWELPVVKS